MKVTRNNPCWLCGHGFGIIQPSEVLSLPDLIRCDRCNANQGYVPSEDEQ